MLSAQECIAKAKAVADRVQTDPNSTEFLNLAEQWLDLSWLAEWQDAQVTVLDVVESRQVCKRFHPFERQLTGDYSMSATYPWRTLEGPLVGCTVDGRSPHRRRSS